MKKILKIVCTTIIIATLILFGYEKYRSYQTTCDLSTDEENAVITGIWNEENVERYKYLIIPDENFEVNSWGLKRPYAKVTDIGESAFEGNIYIESVYIPVNIVRIRSNAFKDCTSIQSVSYAGTEQQWKQIVIEAGNEVLTNLSVEYEATMPRLRD